MFPSFALQKNGEKFIIKLKITLLVSVSHFLHFSS